MKHSADEGRRMLADIELMVAMVRPEFSAMDRAMRNAMPGYPTSTMGGPGGSGGDPSDPTPRFALHGDMAGRDHERMYGALEKIHEALVQLYHLRVNWRPATAVEKRCNTPGGCPKYDVAAEGRGGKCWHCYNKGRGAREHRVGAVARLC